MSVRRVSLVGVLIAAALAGCGRLAGSPGTEVPVTPTAAVPTPSPTAATIGSTTDIDLDAIRKGLLGPSPVPAEWQAEVDELMSIVEIALDRPLPSIDGLSATEAACATWQPLVGKLDWATGALLERQAMLAHLGQLAAVAPDAIREPAQAALRVVSTAAAAQLTPDGNPAVISTAPREDLRDIGRWAVAHCDLSVTADSDPNAEDWEEADIEDSCELDRGFLEDGQAEFLSGPGDGRYATHPHELEISLEYFVYPGWHRIASVDNDGDPPTMRIEPIPGSFCDR
jgi:hypothetical protein